MKLQLLVPQYKEDDHIISNLLNSILLQRNIDFKDIGIIVVNDGSDIKLSKKLINSYPFEIKYILAEHKGVSAARNRALKEATADYVMFCDADDMFYHALAIQSIFKEIDSKHFDCLWPDFIEELKDNKTKEYTYTVRTRSFVFVHGKVYNRQFLLDHDIWWDEELTLHEDAYFNGLAIAQVSTDKLVVDSDPYYMWCFREGSISRNSIFYILNTYDQNLKAQDKLVMKLMPVNVLEAINLVAIQLYQTFFLLTGTYKDIATKNKEAENKLNYVYDLIAKFYDKFKDCYRHVSESERDRLFASSKNGSFIFNEKDFKLEDFNKWLEELKKKYNIEFDDSAIM